MEEVALVQLLLPQPGLLHQLLPVGHDLTVLSLRHTEKNIVYLYRYQDKKELNIAGEEERKKKTEIWTAKRKYL